MAETKPVLIVDPVILFREGLRHILKDADFQPEWCSDSPPVVPLSAIDGTGIPILVVGGPTQQAVGNIAIVKQHHPETRVVLLFDSLSWNDGLYALRSGVNAIVPRGSSCDTLIDTLSLVLNGISVLPSDLMKIVMAQRDADIAIHAGVAFRA